MVRDDSGGTGGMINAMPVLVLSMHMTGVCGRDCGGAGVSSGTR